MRRSLWFRLVKNSPRRHIGLPRFPHPLATQLAPLAQCFYALSDMTRIDILELLSGRERSQSDIAQNVGTSQSNAAFHLRVLREARLIDEHRDGRWRFYSLNGENLNHMIALVQLVTPGKHKGTCPLTCCR